MTSDHDDLHTDVKKLTEAFIRFSVRIDQQVQTILKAVQRLQDDSVQIQENRHCLNSMKGIPERVDRLEETVKPMEHIPERVAKMEPWVSGLRWALTIAGGAIVLMVVTAIVWAVTQSGAGLP